MPTPQSDLVGKFWLGDIRRAENRTMQYSTPSTSQTGLTATSCISTLHGDPGPRQYRTVQYLWSLVCGAAIIVTGWED
jgi:hypothetical protein